MIPISCSIAYRSASDCGSVNFSANSTPSLILMHLNTLAKPPAPSLPTTL